MPEPTPLTDEPHWAKDWSKIVCPEGWTYVTDVDHPPINTDYQTHEERHDVSAGDVPMAEWGPDGTYCRTCGGVSPDWYDPGYHGLPEVAGQYHRGHKDGCPRNTDYREQTHG